MNRHVIAAGTLAVLAAGGGYWLGHRDTARDLAGAQSASAPAGRHPGDRPILYYRNPMGLPDTSPVPKKDSMGMDYVPVYAEGSDEPAGATSLVRIDPGKIQKLGVRTETAQARSISGSLHVSGRIEVDEGRQFSVTPKFEGYVDRLYVKATGQPVAKGQPLFEAYSPELVATQREYAIAAQGMRALQQGDAQAHAELRELAAASLQRLRSWDVSEAQIQAIAESARSRHTLTFRSPVGGVVVERKAVPGLRFMPGEPLFLVSDLSTVWLIADVPEADIGSLQVGAASKVRMNAYPNKVFEGPVTAIYPTLKAETRTVPVRVQLINPGLLLKPAMFAEVELSLPNAGKAVTVPTSAVIDSGKRQVVLVQIAAGHFEPRTVKLGRRSGDYIEIIEGIAEGEPVVVAANFLIDAESNLQAAIDSFGPPGHGTSAKPPVRPEADSSGAHVHTH